jgi:hypothetical protein
MTPLTTLRPLHPAPPAPVVASDECPQASDDRTAERILVCARCGQRLTSDSERISVKGAHEHTFANPHGIVFHIGCFAAATGCQVIPPPSSEWSWFPGYAWEIELCGACEAHLGWLFQSSSAVFHGFILDRLRSAEPRRQP